MWKRPAVVAPGFGQPATYNPITGMHAPLGVPGIKSRVALMQVLEIHDDYLVCRGFDPEDNRFYNAVAVAKPYLLQKTPWDGRELTLPEGTLPDTVVTYDYPEGGNPWRTATYDNGTVEQQNVSPPWFVGDVIAAVKPRSRLGDTPGTPTIVAETDEIDLEWGILYDESNKPIHWMDLNVAGRCVAPPSTTTLFGKLDADLAHNATTGVTVSVWDLDEAAAWVDTDEDIEDVLPPAELAKGVSNPSTLPAGSWVSVAQSAGKWRVVDFPRIFVGKLDSEMTPGSNKAVSLHFGSTDTGVNVRAYAPNDMATGTTIAAGAWVCVAWIRDRWVVVSSYLPATPQAVDVTVITAIQLTETAVQIKTRVVKVLSAAAESAWTDAIDVDDECPE